MLKSSIENIVKQTFKDFSKKDISNLKKKVATSNIKELVDNQDRLELRKARLKEAEIIPSRVSIERILGINNLLDVNYLLKAYHYSKAVCRVIIRNNSGREIGYGTGFKISPNLVMTNNHVLETIQLAADALLEFNYEADLEGRSKPTTRFKTDTDSLFFTNVLHDVSVVAIDPEPIQGDSELDSFGFLQLVDDVGKINPKEFVTIIQHPGGQPKQIALRDNQLLEITQLKLLYQSDTAQGSSGAPLFNDSWQIVGLHHSGVPRTDSQGNWLLKNGQVANANSDDSEIDWIANAGIRASKLVILLTEQLPAGELKSELQDVFNDILTNRPSATELSLIPESNRAGVAVVPSTNTSDHIITPQIGGARIHLPLTFDVMISSDTDQIKKKEELRSANEGLKMPEIDYDYSSRTGYNTDFLGIEVPLPKVINKRRISKLIETNDIYIPYEHFTVVMNKVRRLALFTISNVDARRSSKRPEQGMSYSRKALGGLRNGDSEKWEIDSRIPSGDQLPDAFLTKDRQSFDKGHLVRRDDVTWGDSYDQVKRANGDTFHMTNCSPQVLAFNRSNKSGLWGKLENNIFDQAKHEKLTIISGPLLLKEDPVFSGVDENNDELNVQIPTAYWKVAIANEGGELRSYAFVLEQDLSNTDLEFAVDSEWLEYHVSIEYLEDITKNIVFPSVVKDADQFV